MIVCPRCGQQIDETKQTTCPACSTPLTSQPASPQAPPLTGPTSQTDVSRPGQPIPLQRPAAQDLNAGSTPSSTSSQTGGPPPMPGAYQPTVRRTLSGEIIEEAPTVPAPPQPGGYAGSTPTAGSSGLGVRPAPPNVVTMARRQERPAASRSSAGPIAAVLAVVVLLALAGFGGWWFYTHRGPTPKQQADKFLASLKSLDFKGMYETFDVDTSQYPTEESYVQKAQSMMNQTPGAKDMATSLLSTLQFKTGEPAYSGDQATVPVTTTGSIFGIKVNRQQNLTLKRVNGIWKISRDNPGMASLANLNPSGLSGMSGGGGSGQPGGF